MPILKNISFALEKGEVATLIGASGSGKTTLFKVLTGLLMPQHGDVHVAGLGLPEASSQVAYMMQEDLLLPWRTVLKNLTLPSELGGNPKLFPDIVEEARKLLREVDLEHSADMLPEQLSGGMRQRVSLARALLQKRPLLLLDEPFCSLDVALREQMYDLLRQIKDRFGTTMLMVTHDFRDALSLSDRIFFLSNGSLVHEWRVPEKLRVDPIQTGLLLEEMRRKIKE